MLYEISLLHPTAQCFAMVAIAVIAVAVVYGVIEFFKSL